MNVKLYQINLERDHNRIAYMNYDALPKFQHSQDIESGIYDKVFEGELKAEYLENLFEIFNLNHPKGYHGRSMSVSDVVGVSGAKGVKDGCYFCDSIGFREIAFDPAQAKDHTNTIRVVLCEPGKLARIADIDASLEGMQQAVGGGLIEQFSFCDEPVCIVCNEEGKINGMPLNRAVYADGQMIDIIAGPFFICNCSGENYGSLSEEQQVKYRKQFQRPERFARFNDKIVALPFTPKKEGQER